MQHFIKKNSSLTHTKMLHFKHSFLIFMKNPDSWVKSGPNPDHSAQKRPDPDQSRGTGTADEVQ